MEDKYTTEQMNTETVDSQLNACDHKETMSANHDSGKLVWCTNCPAQWDEQEYTEMRERQAEVIGNIYENPELLK